MNQAPKLSNTGPPGIANRCFHDVLSEDTIATISGLQFLIRNAVAVTLTAPKIEFTITKRPPGASAPGGLVALADRAAAHPQGKGQPGRRHPADRSARLLRRQ
jgi:hypothetical protein